MDKKTLAYILIGGGVLAAIYYVYTLMKDKATAGALGAGSVDSRGAAFAADDDAAYTKMRNAVKAHRDRYNGEIALGSWIDQLVTDSYAAGPAFHNIKGMATKAGSFLSVMEAINPHPQGLFTGNQSGGHTQLFPDDLMTSLWNTFTTLKAKYGGL